MISPTFFYTFNKYAKKMCFSFVLCVVICIFANRLFVT